MRKINVSIITVCYNSEATIERTIKSVLNQTISCYEYIIIDGSSTDKTLEIIKKYEPLFNGRMKCKSEPDKGIYDAMNKGIHQASGDIIGIVNSDDWLEADAVALVIDGFIKNNCNLNSIYCGWLMFHYSNGNKQILKTDHKLLESYSSSYIMAGIRHPAVFVPKEIYEDLGDFDDEMKILADTDLILRCYYKGVNFYYIDRVLSNMADGGISNRKQISSTKDYKLILKKYDVPYLQKRIFITKYYIRMVIKSFLPSKLIEVYRKRQ